LFRAGNPLEHIPGAPRPDGSPYIQFDYWAGVVGPRSRVKSGPDR
jgi:hypothetical protein